MSVNSAVSGVCSRHFWVKCQDESPHLSNLGQDSHWWILVKRTIYLLLLVPVLIISLSCSRGGKENNFSGVIKKDEIVKKHPVLASDAKSFEDVFVADKEIQLETRKDNPIGSNAVLRIGPRDQYLVLDRFDTKMAYLFDSLGFFVRTIGTKGKGPGEYEAPNAPAFDQSGNIYVHDMVRLVVNKYDHEGKYLMQLQVKKLFDKLCIDPDGNLLLYSPIGLNKGDATVYKFDSVGNLISTFGPLPESFTAEGGSFGGGIAIDSAGRVCQITPYEYRVQVYSNNGELLQSFGEPPSYFRPLSKPTQSPQSGQQALGSFHASWTHIWNFFLFDNSIVMILTGDNIHGKDDYHLDLYDLAGNAIRTSLHCTYELAMMSFVKGSSVYVLVQEEPDEKGKVRNPKVVRYRMR